MDTATLAYLAGAMDSDGYFSIKKSTYHRRVRQDAVNAVYIEKIGLKQVTPHIPRLLQETFGGSVSTQKAQTQNSKPLFCYGATNRVAAAACAALLPYLRIKQGQAKVILELRQSRSPGYGQVSYWFELEYPNWQDLELMTVKEVVEALKYSEGQLVKQAIANKTLIALPFDYQKRDQPRVPRLLVQRIIEEGRTVAGKHVQAPELVAWRERLFQQIRELNKTGIEGTPTYHRTGPYTLKE